jgi:predicted transcriptional regulator
MIDMTVISSSEFAANQQKYFNLAMDKEVYIRNGNNMFMVSVAKERERKYLEPDEDFRRAITMDEFLERALVMVEKVDKMYAKK